MEGQGLWISWPSGSLAVDPRHWPKHLGECIPGCQCEDSIQWLELEACELWVEQCSPHWSWPKPLPALQSVCWVFDKIGLSWKVYTVSQWVVFAWKDICCEGPWETEEVVVGSELEVVCSSSSVHGQVEAPLFEWAAPLALEVALEKAMVLEPQMEVDQQEACHLHVHNQVEVLTSWV